MLKMKFLVSLCFMFLVLTACAPAMQSQRVSLDDSDKLAANITDKWVAKDTQLCVQDILKQIESHKGFKEYMSKLGRRPKLFISEVQNVTSEA
jgi:hypothetical protein